MITLQTAQNALKTIYLEAISNQLNSRVDPVFNMIKQSSADVYGRNIIKLVPYGLNGGIGAGDETGALPESAESNYVNFTTSLKNLYGMIEISDKAIRSSANDEGAFVNLLTAEMDGLLQSSKFNISRMFYGDGSGNLVKSISAVDTTNKAMTVNNSYAFGEGMLLDFYLSNVLDASMKGVEVVKVDHANKKGQLAQTLGDALDIRRAHKHISRKEPAHLAAPRALLAPHGLVQRDEALAHHVAHQPL